MTLWMLLASLSGFGPVLAGIQAGKAHGLIGIIVGTIIGIVIGFLAVGSGLYIFNSLSRFPIRMEKTHPIYGTFLLVLLYVMLIAWAFAATGATVITIKYIPWK